MCSSVGLVDIGGGGGKRERRSGGGGGVDQSRGRWSRNSGDGEGSREVMG